jgi:hypothetical protein
LRDKTGNRIVISAERAESATSVPILKRASLEACSLEVGLTGLHQTLGGLNC